MGRFCALGELLCVPGSPGSSKKNRVLQRGEEKGSGLSDQQLQDGGVHDCRHLQGPLADRVVFQVDQAEPEDQIVSGNQQKRGDDPDPVRAFIAVFKPGHSGNPDGSECLDRYLNSQPRTFEANQDRTDTISAKFPRIVVVESQC